MNHKYYLIIIALIEVQFSMNAQSGGIDKVGTTLFQFLKVIPDARSTGMGEAFISVVNNADAVFWNPAALTKVDNIDVSISFVDWFLDVNHFSFAGAYNLEGVGVFGLQILFNDVGDIPVTRVSDLYRTADGSYNPGLTGETMHPGSRVIGLSYAKKLTDKFAFGLTVKYAYEDLVEKNASTVMFDGGLSYQTGFKSIEIAVSLRHFGPEVKFLDSPYPLPQTFAIGISANLFAPGEALISQIENQKLLIAYNLFQPRDYSQQHNIGLEYTYNDLISIRGGYKLNYDEEGLSFGAGVNYNGYKVDYSYNDYGEFLGQVHRFSIGFSIN